MKAAPLRVDVHLDSDGCAVVHATGTLDTIGYPWLRDKLLKCAADVPTALIIDVTELTAEPSSALSVFSTVWMRTSDWPAVPLLLVSSSHAMRLLLTASHVGRFVPVHGDVDAAKRSLAEPPARRRATFALPWTTASSAAARRHVADTCEAWGIGDDAVANAEFVATELVENTLSHTHSEPMLRLELRRGMLTVAVSDDDPGLPIVASTGNGLKFVADMAAAWGCTPAANGGKVVWAVLRQS